MHPIRATLSMLALSVCVPLAAQDLEVGLSVGAGNATAKNLDLTSGTLILGTGSAVTTQFSGPWKLAGLEGAYELLRGEKTKFWIQAGYSMSIGSQDYYKDGQDSPAAFTYRSETINGTVSYRALSYGVGFSFVTNKVGEYGVSLARRTHTTKLSGTVSHLDIPGTLGTAGYSRSASDSDFMLMLSMTFVQPHPTYKTFQRISYGVATGGSATDLKADHQGWILGDTYLWRTKPTEELRFAYGFRL